MQGTLGQHPDSTYKPQSPSTRLHSHPFLKFTTLSALHALTSSHRSRAPMKICDVANITTLTVLAVRTHGTFRKAATYSQPEIPTCRTFKDPRGFTNFGSLTNMTAALPHVVNPPCLRRSHNNMTMALEYFPATKSPTGAEQKTSCTLPANT